MASDQQGWMAASALSLNEKKHLISEEMKCFFVDAMHQSDV
jgi:hypothetical protein